VHNFPGANIRLILFLDTSRQAQPSLAAFGKNITRWDIALPHPAQSAQLIAQAKGQAQQKAVRAFLNRLNSSEEQPLKEPFVKKRFTNPFARRKPSMAETAPRKGIAKWLRAAQWGAAILALLAACTVFMYWLNPVAFRALSATTAAENQDAKTASNSVQGKTTDGKKVAKTNEVKVAETAKAAPVINAADPLDELPSEASAGQAWAKKLPPDSYVVQHLALPIFKNVVAWQQANPKLLETHIVAIYKPGEKLAQFALVSGPFKSRSAAIEFTQQGQTPRLAFATPSTLLAERLNPRDNKSIVKPKEARR
jgi:hypothetical protein